MSTGLPARIDVRTSAHVTREMMMPSVREWFDAQLAKDESIAPCQTKGHPNACLPCAQKWDGGNRHNGYQTTAHVHTAWCPGGAENPLHARYVKMSGLDTNLIASAKARLRKATAALEIAA